MNKARSRLCSIVGSRGLLRHGAPLANAPVKFMEVPITMEEIVSTTGIRPVISPAQHAVLDYGVAATFFAVGLSFAQRHRAASTLAFLNGAMVLGMSMFTDYPGGLYRRLSFRTHRTGDVVQAILHRSEWSRKMGGPPGRSSSRMPEARERTFPSVN